MKPPRIAIGAAAVFLATALSAQARAADFGYGGGGSFFAVELTTEVQSRDVVEKGQILLDPKVKGDAVSTRFLLRTGIRPTPQFEFYLLGGGTTLRIDEFDFDSKMDAAYGGGIHMILFESPMPRSMQLFMDARYLRFVAKDKITPLDIDETVRWNEVVGKFGIAGQNPFFRPYGGLRVSFVRAKDSLERVGKLSLREDDNVGFFGGIDIFLDPSGAASVNLEFSLLDVDSIRGGFQFSF